MYADICKRRIKYKCILVGHWYSRQWGGKEGKRSCVFQIYMPVLSDLFLPLLLGTQAILESQCVWQGEDLHFENFSQMILIYLFVSQSSIHSSVPHLQVFSAFFLPLVRKQPTLAHLSMKMPSQSYDVASCPWLLEKDNIRNRQLKGTSKSFAMP